jgi:hypothetical protein
MYAKRDVLSIVLFTITLAGLLGCEAGGGGSTDNDPCAAPKGDRPDWCEQSADATGTPGVDADEPGFCGNGVCGTDENCDCDIDCPCADDEVCTDGVCGADPLADYYWLEGQWKDEEWGDLVDVEVTGWNNEKGAQVEGFSPCSQGWAIKIGDGSQMSFSGQSETGKFQCSNGTIEVASRKIIFTAISKTESLSITYIQQ